MKNKTPIIRKSDLRLKKTAAFMLTFLFITGLNAVDAAYSEMMGDTGLLSLQARRIDQDNVIFSLLGKEKKVNITNVKITADVIQDRAVDILEEFSAGAREFLGLPEWPRKDLPFESKIL